MTLLKKKYQLNDKVKKFNLYVVSGPYCLSSCDQFVSIIKDNNIGTIVGLPSQGSHAPFRAYYDFKLANGEMFSITLVNGNGFRLNGKSLEGSPAAPSCRVEDGNDYIEKVVKKCIQ